MAEHILLTHDDVKAENTEKNPDNVKPVTVKNSKVEKGILSSLLPAKSWNVIRLTK